MNQQQEELELLADVRITDLLNILDLLINDHAIFVNAARESGSPILESEELSKKANELIDCTHFSWHRESCFDDDPLPPGLANL